MELGTFENLKLGRRFKSVRKHTGNKLYLQRAFTCLQRRYQTAGPQAGHVGKLVVTFPSLLTPNVRICPVLKSEKLEMKTRENMLNSYMTTSSFLRHCAI